MLVCRNCGRVIADTGRNPQKLYSTCIDCGRKYEEEERLHGQVPDDDEEKE